MNRSIFAVLVAVSVSVSLAACGGDAESRGAPDGEEGLDTTLVTPVPGIRVEAPAARLTPPTPDPPIRADVRSIPAGTLLTFEVRESVSTATHEAGDGFNLVLLDGVLGPAGGQIPAGAWARGIVTDSHRSTGPEDEAVLGIRVVSIEAGGAQRTMVGAVESASTNPDARDSGSRTAATIATGAAAGAIIGQVLGGNTRSTVTGAAVGTAVGLGVALVTRGGDAQLASGSRIVVRLSSDLVY